MTLSLCRNSDEISSLTISSGELWSTLFVPQKMQIQDKVNSREISCSLSSMINFEFYLQGYQSLTCYVWRNIQTKHLGTCLCLILRNLQLIEYLKANHLVKNFVLEIFHTNQSYCFLVLGQSLDISISDVDCVTIVIYYF